MQTEILNKHMSIGFTVPFLNLISQSFAGAEQIGVLTAAFGALFSQALRDSPGLVRKPLPSMISEM